MWFHSPYESFPFPNSAMWRLVMQWRPSRARTGEGATASVGTSGEGATVSEGMTGNGVFVGEGVTASEGRPPMTSDQAYNSGQ